MKKCPRWAALPAALTIALASMLAPLEGAAAPGPIELWDDPRELLGEPDGPGSLQIIRGILFDIVIRIMTGVRPDPRPLPTEQYHGGPVE